MESTLTDWRTIENDKEKYQAYLCSREWAELREAVRERAGGECERCLSLPMDACHHLTYARKYREELDDLQAICNPCHDFTHGKSEYDPRYSLRLIRYLARCRFDDKRPLPFEYAAGLMGKECLNAEIYEIVTAVEVAEIAGWDTAADILRSSLPFVHPRLIILNLMQREPSAMAHWYTFFDFGADPQEWFSIEDEEE